MARISRANQLLQIHDEAKKRISDWWAACQDEREMGLRDRRFLVVSGGQYEGNLEEQFADRPKPEVNKCRMAHRRLMAEYRKNPITADFIAKDGSDREELANQLDGAYRSDEQDSNGEEAYDGAFDEAAIGGFGAYRYRAIEENEYDDENEFQRIAIEWIPDADVSVAIDMNAKRQDKSDAAWMGVITAYTREAYQDEFNDDVDTWEVDVHSESYDWYTPDLVYVVEYYRVEITNEKLRVYQSIEGETVEIEAGDAFESEDGEPSQDAELLATGHVFERERTRKKRVVKKYILSGSKVLEDCGRVPGDVIPIVVQYGERYIVNGIERFNGIVRVLKDPQRIYNMLIGLLAELAVTGTQEVPIFTPDQMPQQLRDMWAAANSTRYPFLLANPLKDDNGNIVSAGPMSFTKAPEVPPALAALINVVGMDIKELLGDNQSMEEVVSNVSGKAVELMQQAKDMPSFIYLDNAAKARKRGAEIWLAMASELYVEDGRLLRTVGKEGKMGQVNIGAARYNENKEIEREFDLKAANMGVYADVGPSSASKKAAASKDMLSALNFTQSDSETTAILISSALMNLEGEGIQEMRPYFRKKLVKMGVLPATKEEEADAKKEAEALEAKGPDANEKFLNAEAEKAEAQGRKYDADTVKVLAETEKTQAETYETLSGIDRDDQAAAMSAAQAMQNVVAAQPQQTGANIGQ